MNKMYIAAISGVAFGAVLGGIAVSRCSHGNYHRMHVSVTDCPAMAPACPAVLPPAPPLPSGRACGSTEPSQPAPYPMAVDAQLSRAQTEYVNGNFQRTVELALPLASQSPERAFRIVGAAACNLHDTALADRAFLSVHRPARQYLIYACQRNQMIRVDDHFKYQP